MASIFLDMYMMSSNHWGRVVDNMHSLLLLGSVDNTDDNTDDDEKGDDDADNYHDRHPGFYRVF